MSTRLVGSGDWGFRFQNLPIAFQLLLSGLNVSTSATSRLSNAGPAFVDTGSMHTMMITGTPVFLVICAPSLLRQNWSAVSPLAWAGLAYSAFLAIALSHSIWNYGVRKIGSTRTAIYSNITPVTALVVAWVALDETPTPGQILGALVIFTGLYLVRHGLIAVAPPEEVEEEMEEATLGPGKV